ncbi:unnamed protein product [Thlaspi arvense]|uniref:G-patch domain-containing protein n=1 Tax=Thlaspi arvense TaxID=13288 RepID=A0AAU9T467_THLAR|nr:unnamed protein product [Thlaspi arvense]
MKLSFSLRHKPKSKFGSRNDGVDEGNLKEFVTVFDPSKTLADAKPRFVIPPIENRWRPHKESHLPLQAASGLQFEAEIPSVGSDNITYGLNLRQNVEEEDKPPASKPEPVEQMLLKRMRKDLESLPDAPRLEDFESVPVEGFGAALLAGYGWKPGQGIGLKAKEDAQIFEHKKLIGNAGFGFSMDRPSFKVADAAKLQESGKSDEIGVKRKIIEKLGRVVSKRSRETERGCRTQVVGRKQNGRGQSRETREKTATSWLRSRIKVRVISKDVKGGRLYLKKAVVTDVVGPTTCDITMDETQELVQGIDQELLETALPRRGGPVLVLSGRHKGVYGSLVEKDLDEETGVVCCDVDSKEMLDVKLEQVAEYMGDPDDSGY